MEFGNVGFLWREENRRTRGKTFREGWELTANSTHTWHRPEWNADYIGGRRALSPRRRLCSPYTRILFSLSLKLLHYTFSYGFFVYQGRQFTGVITNGIKSWELSTSNISVHPSAGGWCSVYVFAHPTDPTCPVVVHFVLVNKTFKEQSRPGLFADLSNFQRWLSFRGHRSTYTVSLLFHDPY